MLDKTFKGNEQIDRADVTNKNVQYLYSDGTQLHFMDQESYEQFELPTGSVGDQAGYMKDGDSVQAQLFDGRIITRRATQKCPAGSYLYRDGRERRYQQFYNQGRTA